MKERFNSIISYVAEHKQSILGTMLGILMGIGACIFGLAIIGAFLPVAIPAMIGLCILYKIFTGFPSIFGSLVQVAALALIVLGVCGLIFQNASSEEDKTTAVKLAAAIFKLTHAPTSLATPLLTEIGAWSAIGIGVAAGLIGEMICGITAIAMAAIRIGDKIKNK